MKATKEVLLVLTSAGTEIAWRYAWGGFLISSILHRPFPLPVAIGAFVMAGFCNRWSAGRNWRRLQAAFLHLFCFVLAALLIVYGLFFRESPFFDTAWIAYFINQLGILQQWFLVLPILFCLLLFWMGGRAFEKNPLNYFSVCLQFDRGLGAFFLLLLIKFLIQLKGGLPLEDPATGLLVIAFFIFSLLSIGLARGRDDTKKFFLDGYHGIGVILGFTTTVVLCGAGLILLTYPYLIQITDSAHIVLKEAAEPLGPIIVKIVRFIFGRSRFKIETGGSGSVSLGMAPADPSLVSEGELFLRQIIGWGLTGILGLMAVGALGYLLKRFMNWLLERKHTDEAIPQSSTWLLKLFYLVATIAQGVWHKAMYLLRGVDSAASVYAGILCWGRRSGLPPMPSETPAEYGVRLQHQFPDLEEEIEMIIEAFNREVYGNIMMEQHALGSISAALNRMRSPRHWPARVRIWLN